MPTRRGWSWLPSGETVEITVWTRYVSPRRRLFATLVGAAAVATILAGLFLSLYSAPLPRTTVAFANAHAAELIGLEVRIVGLYEAASPTSGALRDSWGSVDVAPIQVSLEPPLQLASGRNYTLTGLLGGAPGSMTLRATEAESLATATSAEVFVSPVAQKIFYIHMPTAWVAYLAFGVSLLSGIAYLRSQDARWDDLGMASVEAGIVFATIALATGPLWGQEEWGVAWRWEDARLTTTFVLWLVYIAYLVLRANLAEPSVRARLCAAYAILAFVTVPLSYLSALYLRTLHPQLGETGGGLSPAMLVPLALSLVGFTLLYAYIVGRRVETERLRRVAETLAARTSEGGGQ